MARAAPVCDCGVIEVISTLCGVTLSVDAAFAEPVCVNVGGGGGGGVDGVSGGFEMFIAFKSLASSHCGALPNNAHVVDVASCGGDDEDACIVLCTGAERCAGAA